MPQPHMLVTSKKLAWKHLDNARPFLAQEVSDLYPCALVLNGGVDGEVGIHQPHLVLKAACHPLDEVLRVNKAKAQQLSAALRSDSQ